MKLIAFDFDGTLVNNWLQTVEKLQDAADTAGVDFTARDTSKLRKVGWVKFFRTKRFRTFAAARFLLSFFSKMRNPEGDVLHIPQELVSILTKLAADGNYVTVVSSASERFIRPIVVDHGLNTAVKEIFGDEPTWGKHNRLRKLKQEVDADEYIYVGDEIRDAVAASKAGYTAIAVDWGYQDASLLRTRFKKIASSPDELSALLTS